MRIFKVNGLKLRARWLPPGKYFLPPFKPYWLSPLVADDIAPPYPQITLERGVWVTDFIPLFKQYLVEQRLNVEVLLTRLGKGWRVISDVEYRLLANWNDFYSVKHPIKSGPPPIRAIPIIVPHPWGLVPAEYKHMSSNLWWGRGSALLTCPHTVLVRTYGSRIKAGVPQFNGAPLHISPRRSDWRVVHHGWAANPEYEEDCRHFTYFMYRNGISRLTLWEANGAQHQHGGTHLVYTPD